MTKKQFLDNSPELLGDEGSFMAERLFKLSSTSLIINNQHQHVAMTIITNIVIVLCPCPMSRVFDDDKSGTMDFGEFVLATNCTSLTDPLAKVR